MKFKKYIFFLISISAHLLIGTFSFSQQFHRADSIKVKVGSNFLKMPWVGGHNYCQFSDIDINQDGKKDLFVFDRTGHKITTYINGGTPNTVDYYDSTYKYASKFPHMEDWALLRDYDNDGRTDIFTYAITVGGIKVWRNTSTPGNLQFTLQTPFIQSDYNSTISNLYISRVDLPTIDDIDGDGDLDILTFDFASLHLEYHINKSQELGYGNDSLIYVLDLNGCWGNFSEDLTGCNVKIGQSCRMGNYDSLFATPYFQQYHIIDIPENTSGANREQLHAGNCSMCIDEDNDGDKEVFLGQLSCCNYVRLLNGGSAASANMTAMDTLYPAYNVPALFNSFPCGFYVDVDNDSNRDLILAPNTKIFSLDYDNIWYYKNIGTDSTPVFQRQTRSLFENNMIDMGSGADPIFFDYNQDGLTDILITNYGMITDSCNVSYYNGVRAYKNIGTPADPIFQFDNNDFNTIDAQLTAFFSNTITGKHLTFGDIDGDGDYDMLTGDYDGKLHYFKNNAGAGNPLNLVLAQANDTDYLGAAIDIGSFSTPQLIDADRDGDLDLIIGERAGNVNYYENIGSSSSASFKKITDTLGRVDVLKPCCTGYSVPFMYDSAGTYHLLVGSEAATYAPAMGWIWHFTNIDNNLGGTFTRLDSAYQNIWEGERMCVNGADINSDGKMDLVVGNYRGGVAIYMADSLTGIEEYANDFLNFNLCPNPAQQHFEISGLKFPATQIEILNAVGEKVYSEKIANKRSLSVRASLPAGMYFCKLSGENFSATKKLVILK